MKRLIAALVLTFALTSTVSVATAEIDFPACFPCPEK